MNLDKYRIVIIRSNLKVIVICKDNREWNEIKNRDYISNKYV